MNPVDPPTSEMNHLLEMFAVREGLVAFHFDTGTPTSFIIKAKSPTNEFTHCLMKIQPHTGFPCRLDAFLGT